MDNSMGLMKKFSQSIRDYGRHETDSSAEVQKLLQTLASVPDPKVFDPSSEITGHFFISLHQLLSGLDSTSMLVSSAVAALQAACKNKQAQNVLIHTYKFIPVLARFLSTNHITDKQLRLLQLLSNLTYGVKITWQEAHIPQLVSTLGQIIMGSNREHKTEALCVLVNLCYKNLPVLYVLMRQVQLKKLLKCVMTMNDDPVTRMLVCKFLFIVSEVKGPLPEEDILRFIDGAFNCVSAAFRKGDVRTLRHVTDFFGDISENNYMQGIFSGYPKLYEETKRLMELVPDTTDSHDAGAEDVLAVLLEFLPSIFRIKSGKMFKLIPNCVVLATPWLERDKTAEAAMKVLAMATESVSSEEDTQEIVLALSVVLDQLCAHLIHHNELKAISEAALSRLSGIISLVSTMTECPDLRRNIISTVDPTMIKSLLSQIYNVDMAKSTQQSRIAILLLFLVSTLSTYSEDWMALYLELISKKQVQNSIALTMLTGDKGMKLKVLRLVGSIGWGKEALSTLCEILTEHTSEMGEMDCRPHKPVQMPLTDSLPLMPIEGRIDELLQRLNGAEMRDANTSAVMELYEYKLASMGHVERQTQAALEASDARCVGLSHQVAQLNGEVEKLHKLLLYQQQTLDGSSAERRDLLQQIDKLSQQSAQEKNAFDRKTREFSLRISELEMNVSEKNCTIQIKQRVVNELETQLEEVNSQLMARNAEYDDMTKKYTGLSTKYEETSKALAATEGQLRISENHVSEYKAQMGDLQAEHEEVKSSLSQCMERLSNKDDQIEDLNKKVHYLEQIREAVISVANANMKDKF